MNRSEFSRTPQPHPRRRMGLPAALHLQRRADRGPVRLPPHLQPPPLPHRPRRPTPNQPSEQRYGAIQLAGDRLGEAGPAVGVLPVDPYPPGLSTTAPGRQGNVAGAVAAGVPAVAVRGVPDPQDLALNLDLHVPAAAAGPGAVSGHPGITGGSSGLQNAAYRYVAGGCGSR